MGQLEGGFFGLWMLAREIEKEVLWIDLDAPGNHIDTYARAVLGCGLWTKELHKFVSRFLLITPEQLYDLGHCHQYG